MKKVKAVLLSVGIIALTSAVLLAILALVVSKMGSLPKDSLPFITTMAGCVAVFLGAFCSSLYIKEKGILFGILGALIFALCAAVISVFVFQNDFGIGSAGKLVAVLLSGCIGGVLGVNRKSRVKF